jgi:hypothetical protein
VNPIEAGQLRKWLDDNGAVLIAHVEGGTFVVLVRSTGAGPVMGIGQSLDFEEAIRLAQHYYDLGAMQLTRITSGPVGQA